MSTDRKQFATMWNDMQLSGYFERSAYYSDVHDPLKGRPDDELDGRLMQLDFAVEALEFPIEHSPELERSIVNTESFWLPRMFDLPAEGLAVDIGCGYGRSEAWMKDRFDQVAGVDISQAIIEKARVSFAKVGNVSFHVGEADRLPDVIGDGTAAFIYAFTVFQHIPREFTANYLRQARSKLQPGGLMVFNLLSEMNEQTDDGEYGKEWMIGYSRQQALQLVRDAGLVLDKLVRWSAPGAPASWLWVGARNGLGKAQR